MLVSRKWKHKCLSLTPIILCCCVAVASSATNVQQQAISINDNLDEGQHLFHQALKQLESIQPKLNQAKTAESFTDKLIAKIWPEEEPENQEEQQIALKKQYDTIASQLEQAAHEHHNNDALLLLAELNFFSKYGYPRNYNLAFDYYEELASKGNATAQQMVGFIYATGVGNVVKRDQAKALLYHTFAALGGDTEAEMTLGYRYLLGIGTDEKCEDALYYYKSVAKKAIDYYKSGPPGGHSLPLPKVRLSDKEGGVYGYGASIMTDKKVKGGHGSSEKSVSIDEVLQYWRYLAQTKADTDAQLMLGQLYYLGTRSIPRNYDEARFFFLQIIEKATSGSKTPEKNAKIVGQAAGYLGKMYWRGEGVPSNPEKAFNWFKMGAELDDSNSQNGLGLMYLNGIVVPKSRERALEYFNKAADHDNADAQVNLAIEYYKHDSTLSAAIALFTKAAEAKNILAYWYLAQLNDQGIHSTPSCRVAVSYYKAIAERGDWEHPTMETAYTANTNGDRESALLYYTLAAERGYEIAQSNLAYLLDSDKSILTSIPYLTKEVVKVRDKAAEQSAFIYWSRSANQNNVDSRVKMGDYYYKGIGTNVDYEKAAACYRIAAELQLSPLAMWNLGWMYENGIGVSKDFHLAKRAYDSALNTDQDAYLPVKLSLIKMYLKYYWEWLTGGEVGRGLYDDSNDKNDDDFTDSIIQRKKNADKTSEKGNNWNDMDEEMKRQYKMRKQKEREESDFFDGDSANIDSQFDDDSYSEEDELVESLLILALCIIVGWLVYVRQFRFGQQRQPNDVPENDLPPQ